MKLGFWWIEHATFQHAKYIVQKAYFFRAEYILIYWWIWIYYILIINQTFHSDLLPENLWMMKMNLPGQSSLFSSLPSPQSSSPSHFHSPLIHLLLRHINSPSLHVDGNAKINKNKQTLKTWYKMYQIGHTK